MDTSKLQAANIPESQWPSCYISTDGMIFTPQFDKAGTMTKTGERAYNDWVTHKNDTPPPSATDILGQQAAALTLSLADKDKLISQLGTRSVQMQLDIASLKGGKAL